MEPVIVGMDRYELASQLTFYAPDHARSVRKLRAAPIWPEWPDVWALGLVIGRGNRTLLLVAWDPDDISDELTAPYVASLGRAKGRGVNACRHRNPQFPLPDRPRAGGSSSPGEARGTIKSLNPAAQAPI